MTGAQPKHGLTSRRRTFFHEIQRNSSRLRLTLLAYFLLVIVAGHIAGTALLFTADPDEYYLQRYGVSLDGGTEPDTSLFSYVNQVTFAALLLAWVRYRRIRRSGDQIVLALVNARPLGEQRLLNTGEEMAIAAGVTPPRMCIVESPRMNAFTCARAEGPATITITRGLLERLTRDQIQGVVAHEMAHISNGDVRLMTLTLGLGLTFHLISAFALGPLRALFDAGVAAAGEDGMDEIGADTARSNSTGPTVWERPMTWRKGLLAALAMPFVGLILMAVGIALSLTLYVAFSLVVLLFPWLVVCYALWDVLRERVPAFARWAGRRRLQEKNRWRALLFLVPGGLVAGPAILILGMLVPAALLLMRLMVSRNREYQADATAVRLTRNPGALRGALECIRDAGNECPPGPGLPGALNLITIAGSRPAWAERPESGWLIRAFSTHPPLDNRIDRLAEMEASSPDNL